MNRTTKAICLSLIFAGLSLATTISFPDGQTNSVSAACTNFAATCTTTAYFNDGTFQSNDDVNISSLFVSAFDAWNATQGNTWTLNNGGLLAATPGGDNDFSIDPATAQQFGPVVSGGLTINVDLDGVALPTLGDGDTVVWAQGLYDNYQLDGSIVAPFYEMDVSSACPGTEANPIFCPPAYPYQYVDDHFYDQPKASYQAPGSTQAFFDANAYLSVINYNTDTLTVYDGVSYGFQNYVTPEPGTWVLFSSGMVLIGFRYRRRLLN